MMEEGILCGTPPLPTAVEKLLPPCVVEEVREKATVAVEELRLKCGRRSWMLCGGHNVMLDAVLDRAAVEDILMRVCGGSLYAHAEHIKESLQLPLAPLLIIAIGKGIEDIRLTEISENENHAYYRTDGIHYVPKVRIEELILP